jgi:hypothetical protein
MPVGFKRDALLSDHIASAKRNALIRSEAIMGIKFHLYQLGARGV